MRWQPDPTFSPSPKMVMETPAEKLAYIAMLNPSGSRIVSEPSEHRHGPRHRPDGGSRLGLWRWVSSLVTAPIY